MKKKLFITNEYLLTAVFIAAVFFCSCALKHIYPFGNQYLINVNDFRAQSVPIYMHLWDALHGNASLFFDWRIGLGSSFAGTVSHYSLLSPFSLFFLFVSREGIMASITWFILIKLIAMGLTMCLFLKHDPLFFGKHKLSSLWIILGSVAYALNGYTMQYYGFPWMDVGIFVPLLLLNLNQILVSEDRTYGKHELGYALFLALVIIINIPQAFAVCLLLIGYVCGCLFLGIKDREIRIAASIKIILLSMLGLLLSMGIFLPAMCHISYSYRMAYGSYGGGLHSYFVKMNLPKQETERKYRIVFGVLIPLLLALWNILTRCKNKDTRREALFNCYLLLLVLCPVIFESVNGIYHNGPYSCYPMRYGFLTSLLVIIVGLHCVSDDTFRKPVIEYIPVVLWAGVILSLTITGLEPSDSYDYHEYQNSVTEASSVFDRVKLTDSSMEENYTLYLNQNGLSNYVPLNSSDQIEFVQHMGYSQDWVRLIDTGGTLFSDAVMGMNTLYHTVPDGRYTHDETSLHLFTSDSDNELQKTVLNYHYQNGFFISEKDFTGTDEYGDNPFDSQNRMAQLLVNKELFTVEKSEVTDQNKVELEVSCNGREGLYLWSDDLNNFSILINGEPLPIPGRRKPDNTTYPVEGNNGILPLGYYENTAVAVTVQSDSEEPLNGHILIGHLDLDAYIASTGASASLENLESGKQSLSFTYQSEEGGYLVLPLYADNIWTCNVNGQNQKLKDLYGMFLAVPVQQGENTVSLQFTPKYLKEGILISVIALVFLLVLVYAKRLSKSKLYTAISGFAVHVLCAVWVIYLAYVYVIPMVFRVVMSLYHRLF